MDQPLSRAWALLYACATRSRRQGDWILRLTVCGWLCLVTSKAGVWTEQEKQGVPRESTPISLYVSQGTPAPCRRSGLHQPWLVSILSRFFPMGWGISVLGRGELSTMPLLVE